MERKGAQTAEVGCGAGLVLRPSSLIVVAAVVVVVALVLPSSQKISARECRRAHEACFNAV